VSSRSSRTRELLLRAEDHELAHLESVVAQRLAQLVERRLDRRRLGDRVATASSRHANECNTGVAPRRIASNDYAAASRMRTRLRHSTRETCICETPTRRAIASCVSSSRKRNRTISAS
jgi:hypothetical protein